MLYCLFYPKIEYRSIESLNLSNLQKMYKKQPSTPRSQNPIIFQDKLDSKDVFYRNIQIFKSPPFLFWKKNLTSVPLLRYPPPTNGTPPIYIYIHTTPPLKSNAQHLAKTTFLFKSCFFFKFNSRVRHGHKKVD